MIHTRGCDLRHCRGFRESLGNLSSRLNRRSARAIDRVPRVSARGRWKGRRFVFSPGRTPSSRTDDVPRLIILGSLHPLEGGGLSFRLPVSRNGSAEILSDSG